MSEDAGTPAAPPEAGKPTTGCRGDPGVRRPISRKRKWLFRLIAVILIPALALGLLEICLRLAGFGDSTRFFRDGDAHERADVLIENPVFGRWVFPRGLEPLPQPVPFVLPKPKPEGTFRIFVLGESAALGFPDPSTSFARVLEVLLRAHFPRTKFEVINTAMVAINSHVALPIARECAAQQPDLFIVHLGNNEVVGPFGAAGVLGPFSPRLGLIRTNLAIKSTRTGQLFNRIVNAVSSGRSEAQSWEGMAMFLNSQLRRDDERLDRIRSHFRQNLQDICQVAAGRPGANVPVLLCTIPVNLKDSAPFGSLNAPNLSTEQLERWKKLHRQGSDLEANKQFSEAIRIYQQAELIDSEHAEIAYRLGRCFLETGDSIQASRHFSRARDLDVLRFRTDTRLNEVIRSVAQERSDSAVRLVDAESAAANASPHGIPGQELFLEHVHMNFAGNYLLARTLFEAIVAMKPATLTANAQPPLAPLTQDQCAERLAHTEWHELKFAGKIHLQLMQEPPFTLQYDHVERSRQSLAMLNARKKRLLASGSQPAIARCQEAIRLAESDWMLRMKFAEMLSEIAKDAEAQEQYEFALMHLRHSVTARVRVGNLYLSGDDPRTAELHFRLALKVNEEDLEAHVGLAEALEGQGKRAEAEAILAAQLKAHPRRAYLHHSLGRSLARAGKLSEAESRFADALKIEPSNLAVRFDLGLLCLKQGRERDALAHFEEVFKVQPDFPGLREQLVRLAPDRYQLHDPPGT
jgi:Flp pilus assembly protein TadD